MTTTTSKVTTNQPKTPQGQRVIRLSLLTGVKEARWDSCCTLPYMEEWDKKNIGLWGGVVEVVNHKGAAKSLHGLQWVATRGLSGNHIN